MDLKTQENNKTATQTEKLQEEEKEPKEGEQSAEQKARALFVLKEANKMQENRDKGYKYFGFGEDGKNLTLLQYLSEAEKRLNGYVKKPAHKDDWQANVFDNITNDKFISILARLAAQRMKAHFFNDDGLSTDIAVVVTNMYDKAARGKNGQGKDEVFLFSSMFEAAAKGTVVREETYRLGKRKIKNGKGKDGVKYKTIYEWEDVWSEIIPLEEFYPGDLTKLNIQDMGKCAIIQYPSIDDFKIKYSDYEDSKLVKPISELSDEQKTELAVPKDTGEGVVKLVKYYNRNTDSFDIAANGILLTPLDNPLPCNHKQLPFNVGRFELISNNFFYGRCLPHKLSTMQDITNSTWNMMLDMLFIALKTPIFNSSGTDIDVNWLYPGQVIDLKKGVDVNSIKQFQMDTSGVNMAQNALMIIKRRMDESSSSGSEQSGVAGAGRAKTAEEVATAQNAAMEIMGLFLRFMEWAEEDRAEQRIQNMLYYYAKPKKDGKYRKFVVDGVRLLKQELGTMFINITDETRPKEDLNQVNLETEEMSQVVDITPELLSGFKYLIKIVPDSSLKETEYKRRQEALQWYSYTANNPLINQKENIKDLAEAYGKDVSKILNQEKPEGMAIPGMEQMTEMAGGQAGAVKTLTPLSNAQ